MSTTTLPIKNMICHRCIMVVENILKKENINYQVVLIGEIHLAETITAEQKIRLKQQLEEVGFELIDTHLTGQIEKIKKYIIKRARNEAEPNDQRKNLSVYLSEHLHHEYTYLSSLFSSVEGRTIENFFIEQRIEKAKELLVYGQLTLSEIADELEYSSVAHLSSQFKKVTGLTPSYFKELGSTKRKGLDKV